MKVVHIVPGISHNSGGPSRSVQGLVAALNRAGVETWLFSCRDNEVPWVEGVSRFACRLESKGESILSFLRRELQRVRPDIIHIHALWLRASHLAAKIARELGIAYVVSPRGMLDPWAFHYKWWKKWPAWWLYQRWDLKRAAAFCVTAELEAEHVRRFGFGKPIVVSPNGVLLPKALPPKVGGGGHVALFLARIHPGKGVLALAEVWGRIRPEGWEMRVVGPDQYGHKAEVIARLEALGISDQWHFVGELNDEEKWNELRRAELFVFPSVSENFGISIAEALYAELPVIATKGTPWKELEMHRCGWWIDLGQVALEHALRDAVTRTNEELAKMGVRGRKLIESRYTWDKCVQALLERYQLLHNKND